MRNPIHSIAIEEIDTTEDESDRYGMQLYLYAGLENGIIVRTSIDSITGKLTDSRPKYLGAKPVRIIKLSILGKPAVLGLSSRPWLFYNFGRKHMSSLLACPFISVASAICMPNFTHTIMTFSENHLRIISLENFGNIFHCEKVPLDYSAKKLMVFDRQVAIIESQQQWWDPTSQKKTWKSQVSVHHPKTNKVLAKIACEEDEVCLSMCHCKVNAGLESETNYIAIGCAKSVQHHPSFSMRDPKVKVYHWDHNAMTATFLHETEVEDVPLVLETWKEKILAGIGKCLRYYEVGHKRILRKGEIKNLSSPVNTIRTWG